MGEIYQVGRRNRTLDIGRDDAVLISFRPCRRLRPRIRGVLLESTYRDALYELMLPAPWNGSKWRLTEHGHDLATAENVRAALGPLKIKAPADFDVSYRGRALRLETIDPDRIGHGYQFQLSEAGVPRGGLTLREFGDGTPWHDDLEVPEELPVPVAAFLAWLVLEGRAKLRSRRER